MADNTAPVAEPVKPPLALSNVAATYYCARCGGLQDFLTAKPQKKAPNCSRCSREMKPISEAAGDQELKQPHG